MSVRACLSSCGVEWEDIKVKGTVMYRHEWRSVMYSYKNINGKLRSKG